MARLTPLERDERESKFKSAYMLNGGNSKQAAIAAGVSPISASNAGTDMRRKLFGDDREGALEPERGHFYIIDLLPEAEELVRLKLGFSNNWETRLSQHRTTAPTADMVKIWPCKRTWEVAAMDVLSRGEKQIGGDRSEVYDVKSVEEVIHRGNQFFSMMPCLSNGSSS